MKKKSVKKKSTNPLKTTAKQWTSFMKAKLDKYVWGK